MHVHLPKPLHGWREFLGEVGIIVIGVLIALSAEQAVETWHWNNEAEDARAALRAEVRDDAEPQAFARLAIAPCLEQQLKQLQGAFYSNMDRKRFASLANAYLPPSRTWDDQAWTAVIATGVLSHGGPQELLQWSLPYRLVSVLGLRNRAEHDDRDNLTSISNQPGALTPAERDRVTVALQHLRIDNLAMIDGSKVLLAASDEAGVPMTQAEQAHVADELHRNWGKCVTTPNWRGVNPWAVSDLQSKD